MPTSLQAARMQAAAEDALFARGRLALAAAVPPDAWSAVEAGGLRAVLTTVPELSFLCTVTGLHPGTVAAMPAALAEARGAGVPAVTVIGGSEADPTLHRHLRALGGVPAGVRPLAVRLLPAPARAAGVGPRVVAVDTGPDRARFLDVLLAGYAAGPAVGHLLAAEHSSPSVHGFLAWDGDEPVAAAGLSVHGGVAVLGGAATLPARRGRGAQGALLDERVSVAHRAGAWLATATAAAGQGSARNLVRAGFTVHERPSWRCPTGA